MGRRMRRGGRRQQFPGFCFAKPEAQKWQGAPWMALILLLSARGGEMDSATGKIQGQKPARMPVFGPRKGLKRKYRRPPQPLAGPLPPPL
jgi:hypothetical protein